MFGRVLVPGIREEDEEEDGASPDPKSSSNNSKADQIQVVKQPHSTVRIEDSFFPPIC